MTIVSFETGWRATRRHGPRRILSMFAGLVLLSIASCQTPSESAAPLEVVESVDLERILAKGYDLPPLTRTLESATGTHDPDA